MKFEEVKKALGKVVFETVRSDSDSYFEAVVVKKELGSLMGVLEDNFGSPVGPSTKEAAFSVVDVIARYGGIRGGQTLYARNEHGVVFFVMLWPWSDQQRVTVKAGQGAAGVGTARR